LADSTVTSSDAVSVTGGDTLLTKVLGDARLVVEGGLLISSLLKLLELNTTVARLGDERGLELGLGGESEDELALLALVALRNIEIKDSAVAVTDVGVVLSTVGSVRVVAINGDDQARLQVRVHIGEVARAVPGAGRSSGRLLDGRNLGLSDGNLRDSGKLLDGGGLSNRGSNLLSNEFGYRRLLNRLGLGDRELLNSRGLLNCRRLLNGGLLNDLLSHRRKSHSDVVLLGDCLYDGRGLALLSRD